MYNIKLRVALNEQNKYITIDEIEKDLSIKTKKYFCPGCKNEVIARIGKKNIAHFSHKNSDCNINNAQESGLHQLCKQILEDEKCLIFPKYIIEDDFAFLQKNIFYKYCNKVKFKTSFEYFKTTKLKIRNLKFECKIDQIIPDVIIEGPRKQIFIEFAVTHFIDYEKLRKIKEMNYCVLEIDMSDFLNVNFTREMIKNAIITNLSRKKWINYSYIDKELLNKKIKEVTYKNLEMIKIYENNKKRQKEIILKDRDLYIFEENNLKNEQEVTEYLKKIDFLTLEKLPSFLNFKIYGDIIFECDRRIWQTDLFYNFIYRRKNNSYINPSKIISYIKKRQKIYKIDWDMANFKYEYKSLLTYVLMEYLNNLCRLGFINTDDFKIKYYGDYKIKSHIIIPNINKIK